MEIKTIYWNPDVDDSIEGILIDKLSNVGRYKSNLYKIQDDDTIYCIWGRFHLDILMKTTLIGDKIFLKYVGVEEINDHKMKRYILKVNE